MVDQLMHLQAPRELAGNELRRKYSRELGIDPSEIAAIYITPCQAKTVAIRAPAEGGRSHLDGSVGICDVYNDILAHTQSLQKEENGALLEKLNFSAEPLRWCASEAQEQVLSHHRYMSVTGLANIIQVFDDIEKGKLRNIEYLECYACWGGCVNGNLTVDNVYVTLSKIHRLVAGLPEPDPKLEAEVERRYPDEEFGLSGPIKPRLTEDRGCNLKERVRRVKLEEALAEGLPNLDCGLCGAPSCAAFARDVAHGGGDTSACVFLSDERLRELRESYLRDR